MNFRHMILNTVAVSGVLLGATAFAPTPFSIMAVAHADTNISVNFGFSTFYDRLEPYGSWVSLEDDYVFVPHHVDRGWRPYTLGHWSYTNRYGWLWVSTERFGWATYHYGRWGHSSEIGWYWVPGRRWAPAWVAWSHNQNEIAWAPLPPRRGNNVDVDINISIGDVPDYYWQAVPTSAFLSINLSDKIIRDRSQVRTIVQQGTPETVRIENNIVINNVIQVNEIETATNTKVQVLQERAVTSPDAAGKIEANSVAIFNPEVKVDTAAKPKKAVKVEEIVTERKAQGIQPEDVTADQPAAATPAVDKNGKPVVTGTDQPAANVQVPADSKTNPDAPAVAKQKKIGTDNAKPADATTSDTKPKDNADVTKPKDAKPVVTDPPATAAPAVEAPVAKTKKDKAAPADTTVKTPDAPVTEDSQQTTQPKQDEQQPADQPKKKKGKKNTGASDEQPADQNTTAPSDAQTPPVDGSADQAPAKKDKKSKDKCDPNTETCPPAQ